VLEGKAKSFEVTVEATDEYNEWLQKRLSTSVWTDCVSYYQGGKDKSKVVAMFPGPVTLFWWFCRQPKWDDFDGKESELWERERRMKKKWTKVAVVIGLVVVVVMYKI